MRIRVKTIAGNVLLVVASTVIGYLVVELVFFKLLLTNLHLPVRPYLPETAGVLVQETKAGPVPHNYVAILGDSYAEGIGDWLLKAGDDDSHGFHAGHVIHALTGRDVVNFGKGGAGSAEAFVLLPSRAFNGGHCLIFPTIDDPADILAYFFEGNDVEDNVRFQNKVRQKYGRADASAIDAYLSSEYAADRWWRCHLHLGDVTSRIVKFLHLYYSGQMNAFPLADRHPNALLVDGKTVDAAPMPGPAPELGDEEIKEGIQVFDRSLAWLRNRFPRARITVVYIPSPLAIYRHGGPEVDALYLSPGGYTSSKFPVERVAQRAGQICTVLREIAAREHLGFVNPGPTLREAASTRPIHGPIDWGHFNQIGYRIFGEVLTRHLSEPAKVDDCG